MNRDDLINNLVKNIFLLAKLENTVSDKFFAAKLEQKICYATSALINILEDEERSGRVAQYTLAIEKSIFSLDAVLELLKELLYLNLVKTGPLLFSIEQNILQVKLEVIRRRNKTLIPVPEAVIQKNTGISESVDAQKPVAEIKKAEVAKIAGSKKQILDFIKQYPEIRTKDIIYEFNSLSGRTIKRNLTDLLRSGFLRRRVDNKAVYYSITK